MYICLAVGVSVSQCVSVYLSVCLSDCQFVSAGYDTCNEMFAGEATLGLALSFLKKHPCYILIHQQNVT